MTNESGQVWEYIDRFRKSQYFQEVLGQGYLAKWGGIHIQSYLEEDDDEFLVGIQDLLTNNTMLAPKTVEPFLQNNSANSIRERFELFLSKDIEPIDFIDKFLELKRCGVFIASHMLSLATDGDYIIYHSTLYEALMELFPIFEGQLEPVTDGVSYMYFQMACDVIIQTYRFTSIQELHEVLWHGKETNWEFAEK
jgi:hypothetical protein